MPRVREPRQDALGDVRLILFDLDGTIRCTRPTLHEALVACAGELGMTFGEEAQRAGMRWAQRVWPASSCETPVEEAGVSWLDNITRYLLAMGAPDSEAESLAAAIAQRMKSDYRPVIYRTEGAKELLWALRAKGYTLGLISGWSAPLTGAAIELEVIEHFNFTLSAGQVNSQSPYPAIFLHAISRGGAAGPQETLSISANYDVAFLSAREIGMPAVLLDEYGLFPEAAGEGLVIRQLGELQTFLLDS
jgi:FMN phosphatase YigB (HAD superfamily)